MRLSEEKARAIKELLATTLGEDCKVWLFGSRTDNHKRGGDLDIYVEASKSCALASRLRLMSKIQLILGLRKVDLLINDPESEHKAIFDTAKKGIML